jgi:hypothetical protein
MKRILFLIGGLSILVSLCWTVTHNQVFEPWSALLGAIFSVWGFFYSPSNSEKGVIIQRDIASANNESTAPENSSSLIKQISILGFGNKKSITKSGNPKKKKT